MTLKRRFSSFRESQRREFSRMSLRKQFSSFRESKNENNKTAADFNGFKQAVTDSSWVKKEGKDSLTLAYDNGEQIFLTYKDHENIKFKDFTSEVRGNLDVAALLQDSVVMLDVSENTLEEMIRSVVIKMIDKLGHPQLLQETMDTLFMREDRNSMAKTIQANIRYDNTVLGIDQSWFVTMTSLPTIERRMVGMVRLNQPHNFGPGHEETKYIIVVLCPSKIKGTKSALETSRTFGTLFADINVRSRLRQATSEQEFKDALQEDAEKIVYQQKHPPPISQKDSSEPPWYHLGTGILADIRRRLPHYLSDYTDGIFGPKALQKTVSTTMYLYFACLLPIIALGSLNSHNTNEKIGVMSAIVGQFIGGILFALLSGQPLVVIMTTAPIALYIKIVKNISHDYKMDFYATYTCVGLWNTFFLTIYSFTNMAKVMKFMTRSTEEIFSLFICVAFTVDSTKDTVEHFYNHYLSEDCMKLNAILNSTAGESSHHGEDEVATDLGLAEHGEFLNCQRDSSLLFLILMLGTLWLGLLLHRFTSTPYLQANKREIIADYALPVAVVIFSFVGSYLFRDVKMEQFSTKLIADVFVSPNWSAFQGKEVFAGFLLAFPLSLLFFLDQNIAASMVNNPDNKLKKGPAYNWDMLLIGLINIILSIFGLPWMHAVLPHSPLHVRALADIEEHVEEGHVYDIITNVRETRLSNLVSNILIGISILLLPSPLNYIPKPVLDGLFLYLAATALEGNQMFERILLFITEQTAYPPNHYIRRVPQKKIHIFTVCQMFQLLVLCFLGFFPWPYIKVIFPVILACFMPIRMLIMPRIIENKYLQVLDAEHNRTDSSQNDDSGSITNCLPCIFFYSFCTKIAQNE